MSDATLRARIEALIGGAEPPIFLSDRPNKIVRVQHRDDRLCATITESMVMVSDIVEALRESHGETTEPPFEVSAGAERALTEAARTGRDINIAGALYRKINHGQPAAHACPGPQRCGVCRVRDGKPS